MEEFHLFTLPNGLRVIHQQVTDTLVSHCGLMINAGSREEEEHEHGLAHFIEHTIFKGTTKRKAFHILSRLDAVGGELNAYTSKEETCIMGSFLNHHYERAVELLSDIAFHSVFPEKELKKEKEVVIDEISAYLDTPSEQIFDDFESMVYEGHPIARNILGDEALIRGFDREAILRFISKHYKADQMVFSSVGNISFQKLKKLTTKYFGDHETGPSQQVRIPFSEYVPKEKTIKRTGYQAHCIVGNVGYGADSSQRRALYLLNNVLGGPAMNSRLNLNIREKYGFTYNIESNYTAYSDTGIISIYLGTDVNYLEKTVQLVLKELKLLREKKLGSGQLSSAKQQMTGQIALARESRSNVMLYNAKSLLFFDRIESLPEIHAKIEAITDGELLEIANEIFDEGQLSRLTFLPKK